MELKKLSFWTPVIFGDFCEEIDDDEILADEEGPFFQTFPNGDYIKRQEAPPWAHRLMQVVDRYFFFGGTVAHVDSSTFDLKDMQRVSLANETSPIWKSALKIASYVLTVFTLPAALLVAKVILRAGYNFQYESTYRIKPATIEEFRTHSVTRIPEDFFFELMSSSSIDVEWYEKIEPFNRQIEKYSTSRTIPIPEVGWDEDELKIIEALIRAGYFFSFDADGNVLF